MAVLGTEVFDASAIDVDSVLLTRDGVAGGAAVIDSRLQDVATPFEGDDCDCHHLGADGWPDLVLTFQTHDVVDALDLATLVDGEQVPLTVTGDLLPEAGGQAFTATDCVRLVPKGPSRGR